jgi:hypothetical protein
MELMRSAVSHAVKSPSMPSLVIHTFSAIAASA